MMFASFNSNKRGIIRGAGTAKPSGEHLCSILILVVFVFLHI